MGARFFLFSHGYYGVEFFFLVSGYLLAKKLAASDDTPLCTATIGNETYRILWNKLRPILPYHIIIIVVGMIIIIWLVRYPFSTFTTLFINRLPSMFFLHRIGIIGAKVKDCIGVEWYISSMLLSILLIYPIGRKFGKAFRQFAPVLGICILSYLIIETGSLGVANGMVGIFFKCNIRAFGELLVGIGCYEIVQVLRVNEYSTLKRFVLSLFELLCYGITLFYIVSFSGKEYEVLVFLFLSCGVTLSFAEIGLLSHSAVFQSPFLQYLGQLRVFPFIFLRLFLCLITPTTLKMPVVLRKFRFYFFSSEQLL